ncbi:MAG: sigma 54 modulation/S30EA ribosomal C-terminal domain-containing protein [Acidimicrobiales bacterium]|nr:sigma 54 modulation/S30EA ribosomal C-terminal domain-containing protein [Acidimicrobiales bacterium]
MVKPHAVCEVELLIRGVISPRDREQAIEKVQTLCELGHEPVLAAVVKLKVREKAALELPAIAEASIDLNGTPVRAHASGHSIAEAIDLLHGRLSKRLRRRRDRHEDRHHEPEPTPKHAGYSTVPSDEREVVRHKTLAMYPMSLEEAADEMDQLDHGFYLFLDTDHDLDRVVYRNGDGSVHAVPAVAGEDLPGDTRPPIHSGSVVLNHLPLAEAAALLDETADAFVFFADPGSDLNRGNVLYRRFDGHYGLITPTV